MSGLEREPGWAWALGPLLLEKFMAGEGKQFRTPRKIQIEGTTSSANCDGRSQTEHVLMETTSLYFEAAGGPLRA